MRTKSYSLGKPLGKLFVVIILLVLCATEHAPAANPMDEDKATQWVQQLGAASFKQREQAASQLLRMGEAAIPALSKGSKSSNLEIRFRSQELVERIRKAELDKRLLRFVKRGLQPEEMAFAGWDRFKQKLGDDMAARTLFSELYKFDSEFLKLAAEDPELALDMYSASVSEFLNEVAKKKTSGRPDDLRPDAILILQQMKVLNERGGDLLKEIFRLSSYFDGSFALIEDDFKARLAEQIQRLVLKDGKIDVKGAESWSSIANRVGMQKELCNVLRPAYSKAVNRLAHIPRFKREEQWEANSLIRLARYVALEEVLPLAVRLGTRQVNTKPRTLKVEAKALYLVGKYGNREHIEPLKKVLGSRIHAWGHGESSITINGHKIDTRIGDVALAAMVYLSGESLAEYGFLQPAIDNPKYLETPLYQLGFTSEERRQEALAKWKARPSRSKLTR